MRAERRPPAGGGVAGTPAPPPPPSRVPQTRLGIATDYIPLSSAKTKRERGRIATLMAILQSPISSTAVITVDALKEEPPETVELQSSDEDEVVEVALPPRPTICIESSDEDDLVAQPILSSAFPQRQLDVNTDHKESKKNKNDHKSKQREVSTSPVPSVVSSISDEFIRGDRLAFNISRKQDEHIFDFNLHGTDLIDHESNNTLSKNAKRRIKRKNKVKAHKAKASTPNLNSPEKKLSRPENEGECFATPKNKAKRKQDKSKKYTVTEHIIPNPDIYETDSNQSAIESNAETPAEEQNSSAKDVSDCSDPPAQAGKPAVQAFTVTPVQQELVDLTEKENSITVHLPIENHMIMGNVIGLETTLNVSHDECQQSDQSLSVVNPAVPGNTSPTRGEGAPSAAMTVETPSHSKRRRLSTRTVRAEMERFYNESWGGETFNHHEILRQLPRDKTLWAIDPKDRTLSGRQRTCHYCRRPGHRDDRCRLKPRLCHMCGEPGHHEPRCPNRMCLNCGTANYIYSVRCGSCANWGRMYCAVCHQYGHPSGCCPDLWRRYHNTTDNDVPLERQGEERRYDERFCSGCTKRGHLAHLCRNTLPYNNLPIHSPYVYDYTPVYPATPPARSPHAPRYPHAHAPRGTLPEPPRRYFNMSPERDAGGEPSTTFQNFVQRNTNRPPAQLATSISTETEPINKYALKRTSVTSNIPDNFASKIKSTSNSDLVLNNQSTVLENASALNRSTTNKEDVLQDSQVSNTSDIISTAKLYVTKDVMDELSTEEGGRWLASAVAKSKVEVQLDEGFVHIKGLMANQDVFQAELKERVQTLEANRSPSNKIVKQKKTPSDSKEFDFCTRIPHKTNLLLRMLTQELANLQHKLGDPKAVYKEWQFQKNKRKLLLKTKVINPKTLSNCTTKICSTQRKLNMLLLGQAGLADGARHVSELNSLRADLETYDRVTLPREMRQQIGQHYHVVFGSLPRDDYSELLKIFYEGNYRKVILPGLLGRRKRQIMAYNQGTLQQANSAPVTVTEVPDEKTATAMKKKNQEKIELIQSCQKKLRKVSIGNEVTEQSRHQLLNRLRKFQLQIKRHSLFPKQHIQLDKLTAEAKRFLAEL